MSRLMISTRESRNQNGVDSPITYNTLKSAWLNLQISTNDLHFYKGVKPLQSEIASLTSLATYSSDLLVTFNDVYLELQLEDIHQEYIILRYLRDVKNALAVNSGQAVWWAFTSTFNDIYAGDVTDVGGVGEIEMADRNIVNGENVVFTGMAVKLMESNTIV